MISYHTPVMLKEALEGLAVQPGKKYLDATLGGGGHGIEILRQGGKLLGIEVDREAIDFAKQNAKCQSASWRTNAKWGRDYLFVKGNFQEIEGIARENGFGQVAGILFDLGVSSHQLDSPSRGFSYRYSNAPLDLRFDQASGEPASRLINRLSENEIYEILAKFAEEQLARPIARAIVSARRLKPVATTGDLVEIINQLIAGTQPRNATLSRVFQALRIAVNEELVVLRLGLAGAQKLLEPGGRLAVISFHSLEDRIVKQFLAKKAWKLITRKPLTPGACELKANPRSRSAKLRIGELIC